MIGNLRILAVVPARGGSKGVPLKNIHPLRGKPLITHTAELVLEIPEIDRAVVSTDDERIAQIAEEAGLAAPFRRPQSFSGDFIGDYEVLRHAIETMENLDGIRYDIVVMLQPTCPLRRPSHVQTTLQKLVSGSWDSVWTVSPMDLKYHPLKALSVESDGSTNQFDPRGAQIIARQQLVPVYYRNGAAYAITRHCLLDHGNLKGDRWASVVIKEPLISIDTLSDFAEIEALMSDI